MAVERSDPLEIDQTSVSQAAILQDESQQISTLFFALVVGLLAINLTSAQPLIGLIGPSIRLAAGAYGLVSMLVFLGYAAGLVLLVPLTDLFENRRLILGMLLGNVFALTCATLAQEAWFFLSAIFVMGMTTSAIQMLVPLAASLTPPARRGRVVGNIMGGVMFGILLSRPIASEIANYAGWRAVFGGSAGMIGLLLMMLLRQMPEHRPVAAPRYLALVASLWTLLRTEPVLQLCASTAALSFASFSFFWTVLALRLSAAPFHLGADGIGLFALAGCGGTIIAPIAGRLGDRGWTKGARVLMHLGIILAMIIAWIAGNDDSKASLFTAHPNLALAAMMAATLLLDLGVIGDQTLGRHAVNMIRPEARGRLNGLFTGSFFCGGAIGSVLAGIAWTWAGWGGVCAGAIICALGALALSCRIWWRAD